MAYKIQLQPSGHQYTAFRKESLLEAGLRAGYNLRYQCDNGSCGECRSRLISGTIEPIGFSDFALPEAEKAQGGFLMCANQACSDLVVQAEEDDLASEMPFQEVPVKVKRIDRQTDEIMVLQLRTPRTNTFRFLAGQSAHLELTSGESHVYEIASCPCNGMLLEFHIRFHEGDQFCDYVFNQLVVGETLLVKGPSGDFTLNEASERPMLFVAYDTGFAGVKSLIEHAIALEMPQEIFLYRIACEPDKDYLHNVCRSWADAIDNFHYESFEHCAPLDCSEADKSRVCREFLEVLEGGDQNLIANSEVYLSGVEQMIMNLRQALVKRGLSEGFIHSQQVY